MTALFRTLAALLLLVTGSLAAAQSPQQARPALWKVADEDTTIYLFGTIHLLPKGIAWYDGAVATAFGQAGELVTEIPETDDSTGQAVLMKRGVLPPGQNLRAGMTRRERAKYDAALRGFGLPVTAFDLVNKQNPPLASSIQRELREGQKQLAPQSAFIRTRSPTQTQDLPVIPGERLHAPTQPLLRRACGSTEFPIFPVAGESVAGDLREVTVNAGRVRPF